VFAALHHTWPCFPQSLACDATACGGGYACNNKQQQFVLQIITNIPTETTAANVNKNEAGPYRVQDVLLQILILVVVIVTGGPVVSHIKDLSMLLFSVDDGHVSNEIWLKSIQWFSSYVETTKTDNARDTGGLVVDQITQKSKML
jgi:hypothetical protein